MAYNIIYFQDAAVHTAATQIKQSNIWNTMNLMTGKIYARHVMCTNLEILSRDDVPA